MNLHETNRETAPYGQLLIEEHSSVGKTDGEGVRAAGKSGVNRKGEDVHGHAKPFKGYTLEELRYRRLVNRMKIEITQEKIKMLVSPKVKKDVQNVSSAVSGFQTFMRFMDIALVAYSVTRRVTGIFRKFSRRR